MKNTSQATLEVNYRRRPQVKWTIQELETLIRRVRQIRLANPHASSSRVIMEAQEQVFTEGRIRYFKGYHQLPEMLVTAAKRPSPLSVPESLEPVQAGPAVDEPAVDKPVVDKTIGPATGPLNQLAKDLVKMRLEDPTLEFTLLYNSARPIGNTDFPEASSPRYIPVAVMKAFKDELSRKLSAQFIKVPVVQEVEVVKKVEVNRINPLLAGVEASLSAILTEVDQRIGRAIEAIRRPKGDGCVTQDDLMSIAELQDEQRRALQEGLENLTAKVDSMEAGLKNYIDNLICERMVGFNSPTDKFDSDALMRELEAETKIQPSVTPQVVITPPSATPSTLPVHPQATNGDSKDRWTKVVVIDHDFNKFADGLKAELDLLKIKVDFVKTDHKPGTTLKWPDFLITTKNNERTPHLWTSAYRAKNYPRSKMIIMSKPAGFVDYLSLFRSIANKTVKMS